MEATAPPGWEEPTSMSQTAGSMGTLARDDAVIPGVTFLSCPAPTERARACARPRFPGRTPCVQGSGQAGFCPCTLRRTSDPPEPTFGRPCYLFAGVPPQPNRPPDAVPPKGLGSQARVGGVSLPPPGPPKRTFHGLPPTLRAPTQEPTPGCGKAPRGLLSLREVAGLYAHSGGSRGPRPRQRGPS